MSIIAVTLAHSLLNTESRKEINEMIQKILIILTLVIVIVSVPYIVMAEDSIYMRVSLGQITVRQNRACVDIKGKSYVIYRENASYIQFEGRYIKIYDLKIEKKDGFYTIDFRGFRFADALV